MLLVIKIQLILTCDFKNSTIWINWCEVLNSRVIQHFKSSMKDVTKNTVQQEKFLIYRWMFRKKIKISSHCIFKNLRSLTACLALISANVASAVCFRKVLMRFNSFKSLISNVFSINSIFLRANFSKQLRECKPRCKQTQKSDNRVLRKLTCVNGLD